MAAIFPFRAYRYSAQAGDPADLLTEPYDKITSEMQERYYARSPHNLVRVILGRREPADGDAHNVYTRAAGHLDDWMRSGVLVREPAPALFVCVQKFRSPDDPASATFVRKGLVTLGAVEDYAQGTVFRHELTHTGPKRDRLELLRRTRAHCEQLFLLYDDPQLAVDADLDRAAQGDPLTSVADEYGAEHRLWRIDDPEEIAEIQRLMTPHRLLIADGHHRYETALAFRDENPGIAGARLVMMTLVNLRSPGLQILATHRVIRGLAGLDHERVLHQARRTFDIREFHSLEALRRRLDAVPADRVAFGAVFANEPRCWLFEAPARERLDVAVLHEDVLAPILGLTPDAVREGSNIRYVRGFEAAAQQAAQAAFLLRPVRVEQVAQVAFAGGVMPQKSTDFYPKLLSGMAIYKIDD